MSYDDCYLRDVIRDVGLQIVASQPSLRERLICAALQGLLAGPDGEEIRYDIAADLAIKHADAVLTRLAEEKTAERKD
jgi:hypothetical protein